MPSTHLTSVVESQIDAAALDSIVKSLAVPPQPIVVLQMQTEMGKADPDLRKAAQIVSEDIGLTVAVLKTVNSPRFGLQRPAESVEQAVGLIGLRQLTTLVTAISLRSALKGDTATLAPFYEASSRRSSAMARLAREMKNVDAQHAQMFGLFCDVAIPLLLMRFPDYGDTLARAARDEHSTHTAIEHAAHHTDHALIGALMAKTWGLPRDVCLAIRLHHDYSIFLDHKVPRKLCMLVALGLLADAAIQRHDGQPPSAEWAKGGDYVAGTLVLSPDDVEDRISQLHADFAAGIG